MSIGHIPQLDAITHDGLKAWIAEADPIQTHLAIVAGEQWLENFEPETEDDGTLIKAVMERLDMLEEGLQAMLPPGGRLAAYHYKTSQ